MGLDEVLEGLGGSVEEAVSLPGWQLSAGLLVQEVVLQASLDVHGAFKDGGAEVLVCGQHNVFGAGLECSHEEAVGGIEVVFAVAVEGVGVGFLVQGLV